MSKTIDYIYRKHLTGGRFVFNNADSIIYGNIFVGQLIKLFNIDKIVDSGVKWQSDVCKSVVLLTVSSKQYVTFTIVVVVGGKADLTDWIDNKKSDCIIFKSCFVV